ncbi:MAG TPA: amidohydrolase family protein [Sphingobium sp.]
MKDCDHASEQEHACAKPSRREALIMGAVGIGAVCTPGLVEAAPTRLGVSEISKIDIYSHVVPPSYLDVLRQRYKDAGIVKRIQQLRMLWDIDARAEMLDQWPEVQQVITLSHPSPEAVDGPQGSPEVARIANDGLAAFVARHPDKFPTFAAALPMNNVPAAIAEMDRAVGKLGARGIQMETHVNGRALDDPELLPIFEHAARVHQIPIWLHPGRSASFADYPGEDKSRYEIWQVLGWPYDTSAAMARLVFSGVLDRFPDLKIITHHCGGMLPYFGGRAESLWQQMGVRTADEDLSQVTKRLRRPFMEQFRSFYGDTVLGGSSSALRCGLDFFGPDKIVFASDCPFDPEQGPGFIRDGIKSIEALNLDDPTRRKIYHENALRLLKVESKPFPKIPG